MIFLNNCRSREECETWKEKQRQIVLEESQQQQQVGDQTSSFSQHSHTNKKQNFVQSIHSLATIQKYKPIIGAFTKRKVWVEIAELLIGRYQFEAARGYLEEASYAADVFDDLPTKELIAYNYALISHHMRDWGKVISLVDSVMWSQNTQEFWLKKTLLLVEALRHFSKQEDSFQNHIDGTGFAKAKSVLHSALQTVKEACQTRPNGMYLGPYIQAKLLARLGGIVYTESLEKNLLPCAHDEDKNYEERKVLLTEACRLLGESFTLFDQLCYKKESIEVMLLQVEAQQVCFNFAILCSLFDLII